MAIEGWIVTQVLCPAVGIVAAVIFIGAAFYTAFHPDGYRCQTKWQRFINGCGGTFLLP